MWLILYTKYASTDIGSFFGLCIRSEALSRREEGYVFKCGDQGVGYYIDSQLGVAYDGVRRSICSGDPFETLKPSLGDPLGPHGACGNC